MGLVSTKIQVRDSLVSDTNPYPVVLGAPTATNTSGYKSSVSITRPSNTTAYTGGDALGIADAGTPANAGSAILTFANIGPAGGFILITETRLEIDVSSVPLGMTSFRLNLYDASPDAILDNAAWDLSSSGDRGKYLGYLDLGTPIDIGSTLYVQTTQNIKQVKLATSSSSLYGVLVTNGGYTPSSGAVKVVTLLSTAL